MQTIQYPQQFQKTSLINLSKQDFNIVTNAQQPVAGMASSFNRNVIIFKL
jgi:hypothetical protein